MPPSRRYDKYPGMARLVRGFSPEARVAVQRWHAHLIAGAQGFLREYPGEARSLGLTIKERMAARNALDSLMAVLVDLADIAVAPRQADWCCAPGMAAHPRPCPQHGYDPSREYPLGTIISRSAQGTTPAEHAVLVVDHSDDPHPWRSVEFPISYRQADLAAGYWVVAGRV